MKGILNRYKYGKQCEEHRQEVLTQLATQTVTEFMTNSMSFENLTSGLTDPHTAVQRMVGGMFNNLANTQRKAKFAETKVKNHCKACTATSRAGCTLYATDHSWGKE